MQCNICEVRCEIDEYSRGRCGAYLCTGDNIVQYPGMGYLGAYPISIETVPLLHYYPSGKFLQIFSTGCNFQCSGCVTRMLASSGPLKKLSLNPSKVVERALQQECLGIVSTLNEPVANYYLFRDLALQAKGKGLLVGCSTNCYFTNDTLKELGQFVDFMQVGIKDIRTGATWLVGYLHQLLFFATFHSFLIWECMLKLQSFIPKEMKKTSYRSLKQYPRYLLPFHYRL